MKTPQWTLAALRGAALTMTFVLASLGNGCTTTSSNTPIATSYSLRNDMRTLWVAHATWTRVVIIDMAADLPDTPQATARLLQNQVDIGNAIKPFYGEQAGAMLTSLLHDHIVGAAAVITAAKAGDTAGLATAQASWYANGDQIATFLAGANPAWNVDEMKAMMRTHLDQTLAEATARLTGDWNADVTAYDAVVVHILEMADMLAAGITTQFPDLVTPSTVPVADQNLGLAMRGLWQDHVTWTRVYLISAIAGLPDTSTAANRLLQNQTDIGNAIKPFYGEAAGDQLTLLLREHITGAVAVVTAAQSGDPIALNVARDAWYANGRQIAQFLASANPNWNGAELEQHMNTHLDQTLAEATARLQANWDLDVTTYDAVVVHILGMADVLSGGISTQFAVH